MTVARRAAARPRSSSSSRTCSSTVRCARSARRGSVSTATSKHVFVLGRDSIWDAPDGREESHRTGGTEEAGSGVHARADSGPQPHQARSLPPHP